MFIRIADESFDPEAIFSDVAFHQTLIYKKWQQKYGRQVVTLIAEKVDGDNTAFVQCVEYKIPFLGSFWTAYGGPLGGFDSLEQEEVFYKELKKECIKISPKTMFIRIQGKPFSKYIRTRRSENTMAYFAPANEERIIQIEEDLEDVVESFNSVPIKKAIRVLERNESVDRFVVEKNDLLSHFDEVYELLQKTSGTQQRFLQSRDWYYLLFEILQEKSERASLTLGYVADRKKPSSFVVTLYSQKEGQMLLFGSEDRAFRTRIPSLCVYTAIKEAKNMGMNTYNLGETSPDYRLANRMFSDFTDQFGGGFFIIEHPRDIVIRSFPYALFRIIRIKILFVLYGFFTRWIRKILVEIKGQYDDFI